jgi:DnaK suppressor protein
MKNLSNSQISALRGQLQAREQLLSAEIASVLARQQSQLQEGRAVDKGVLDLETGLDFAEINRDQLELDAVHAALGRVDRGTYGRCLSCGAHIPLPRLEVQPEAAMCHVCQSRAESGRQAGFSAP